MAVETSNTVAQGAGAASGPSAALGALAALTGTPQGTAPTTGGAATPAAAASASSFLKLMTQTGVSALGATPGPAGTDAKPATADTAADKHADSDSANGDPDALTAALALVSQLLSSPPSTPAAVPAGAGASLSPTPSGTDATAASLSAVSSPATASGAMTGRLGAASLARADAAGSDASIHGLVSLLLQSTDSDADTAQAPGLPPDTTQDSSQNGASTSPSGADPNAANINPGLGIGSHVPSLQAQPDTHRADVKSPVGTSAWAEELGGRITWMAKEGIGSASLRLSPEHLGPVEVHISMQDGATSVVFGAAQADTRTALEQALPRLREMFATQGLTLADAGVSREPPRQQGKPVQIAPVSALSAASSEAGDSASSAARIHLGLLDTYA